MAKKKSGTGFILLLIFIGVALWFAGNDSPQDQKNAEMVKKLTSRKSGLPSSPELDRYERFTKRGEQTPGVLLEDAISFYDEKKIGLSKLLLETLAGRYPDSREAKEGTILLDKVIEALKKKSESEANYVINEKEKFDVHPYRRIQYRISVPKGTGKEVMESNVKHLVRKLKNQYFSAIAVLVYEEGTQPKGASWSLSATYGPNGKWEDFDKQSTMKFVFWQK